MRVIKFRGYSYARQSWLYGNLIEKDDPQIAEPTPWVRLIHNRALDAEMVAFDSVGQFTGLHDKNGKEIYEGDIVHLFGYVKDFNHRVVYVESRFCTHSISGGHSDFISPLNTEVIGNLYEVSELAKTP
jgi:uncharacterized phage protein (TIGR01671 family)